MKTLFTRIILFLLFIVCGAGLQDAAAQTPGLVFQPAINGGQRVLDPNTDSYVSLNTTGFPGINRDEGAAYSEIPYRPFPVFMNEPLHDILTGNSGGHTDYAPRTYENGKPTGSPLASYFDGTNFMFRVRLGGTSSASMGYSMLIDTDGKFPGGVPNPGFEFEVVFANNFDVRIYDHRTNTSGGDIIFQGSYKQYSHKAVAASRGDSNTDYFYDFYVPLSAFRGGITASTPLRMSGVTVTSAQSGIYGSVSDVGGVDDRLYNGDVPSMWKDIIDAFPPTSLNDIQEGEFPPAITTPPVVNDPIFTNSTVITGTSVEAPGSVITVYQNGVLIGTTVVNPNGTWSLDVPTTVTLVVGDKITAKVDPVDKEISDWSNEVIVQQGTCSETASPPITAVVTQGSKGFSGTTAYLGEQTFTIYKTDPSGVTSAEKFTVTITTANAVSGSNPTVYGWSYTYPSDKTVTSGLYTITVAPRGLCESQPSNQICYDGTGNPTINDRIPTITHINGTAHPSTSLLFEMPLLSVGGTIVSSTSNPLIFLYVNGIKTDKSTTATSTSWTISTAGIVLRAGDEISVRSELNANSNKISICGNLTSRPSNYKVAAIRSSAPTITGSYCGTTTTVSGTSTEPAGSTIRLYMLNSSGIWTLLPNAPHATVTMYGYWTATNLNIPASSRIAATATAPGELEGPRSNELTVTNQQSITGFSINGPVYENAISVSGKAPSTAISGRHTVRLYVNGVATSYMTNVFAANGDWTINDIFGYDIYAGASLSIRVSTPDLCESIASNSVVVQCQPETRTITATLSEQNYCANTAATVNLSSSEPGAAYSLIINGTQSGSSVAGTGFAISLQSGPLTVNPTSITVQEVKFGSVCGTRSFGPFTVGVYAAVPNNFSLSASPNAGCPNMSTTLTISNAQKGYSYQLINATTKALIGSPITPNSTMIPGATGAISFPAVTVPATTTYGLIITNTTTGCSVENANTATVTITGPDVMRAVWANNPVCEGSPATIFVDTQLGYIYTVFDKETNQQIGLPMTGNGNVQSVSTSPLSPARVYTYIIRVDGGLCSTYMLTEARANVIDSGTLRVTAGDDQLVCRGLATTASASLTGSDPSPGQGTWTATTIPAGAPQPTFSNVNDRYATASNLVSGDYVFTWSVVTPCGSGFDTVTITVNCPAVYEVVGPNYWDMFPNGSNLATAFDEDKGVVSATIISGRVPRGSVLTQQGHIVVDFGRGNLEPGNFYITIRTVDFFGHVTETPILIIIYPRSAPPVPMPVELISFKATKKNNAVALDWQTASEKDNDRFEVQRSQDGKTFETIGTVKGKGNSSQKSSYTFTDETPLYGTSYYKLKQVDFDGNSEYSRTESVSFKVTVANGIQFQVFPNPFADELKLKITTEKEAQASLQLVDLQGRVLLTQNLSLEPGVNNYMVPVETLSPGMYLLKVTGNGISYTSKVVKGQ